MSNRIIRFLSDPKWSISSSRVPNSVDQHDSLSETYFLIKKMIGILNDYCSLLKALLVFMGSVWIGYWYVDLKLTICTDKNRFMDPLIWDSFHRYSKADMNSWTSFINSSVVLTSFLNNVWLGHDFERTSAKLENRPRVIRHVEHGKHPDRVSVCCSEFDCGRIRSLKNKWSVMIKTEVTLWPELDELFTKKT